VTLAWTQVGLVNGRRLGKTSGRRLELVDENVMVDAGVRPGSNWLQFQLEQYGRVRVERLVILPDSGIEASPLGPGTVQLRVSGKPGPSLRVGDTLTVTAQLRNPHPRPVRRVTLSVGFDSAAFRLLDGRPVQRIAAVTQRPIVRSFRFRALHPGTARIDLGVETVDGGPGARITAFISARRSFSWTRWGSLLLIGAGVALVVGGRARRRASRRHAD
jgi:hypothetical protein